MNKINGCNGYVCQEKQAHQIIHLKKTRKILQLFEKVEGI